jgi:hypothetical protein
VEPIKKDLRDPLTGLFVAFVVSRFVPEGKYDPETRAGMVFFAARGNGGHVYLVLRGVEKERGRVSFHFPPACRK